MTKPLTPATGAPLLRDEDGPLLRGETNFTADIDDPWLEGAAYVAFTRSPYASAAINGIDATEAAAVPGVIGVLTAADLPPHPPGAFSPPAFPEHFQPLLASDTVRFAGEPVAAVVAVSRAVAADAAELIDVDYTAHEPVLDLDDAVAHWTIDGTVATDGTSRATIDALFESADVIVEETFWNPRQLPAPIECRSVAAVWRPGGQLHVWAATQRPHGYRDSLATLLTLDPQTVHVTCPAVGGAFGGKVSRTPEEHIVPMAARLYEQPVRWDETRSEYFASATQGRGERITIGLAASSQGRIAGLRTSMVKDGGAYTMVGVVLPALYSAKVAAGCYDIGHVHFSSASVGTNRPPTSAFRGAGRAPYLAALERSIDLLAHACHLDPADIRRRNLIPPDAMPWASPMGVTYDEADYPGDLERALDAANYVDLRADQAARRLSDGTRSMGIGIASYNHITSGAGGEEAAVTVHRDGSATVVTGSTSQGHGHATTWAQIAADVLQIPHGSIQVVEGDTDRIASGQGAIGSRSLQTAGVAIHRSANALVERATAIAATLLEAAEADIVLAPASSGGAGSFHVVGTPARAVGWDLIAAADPSGDDTFACGELFDPGQGVFPSGCHVAVVEVDTETGAVQLTRLVAVDDAGTRVNPMIVEGQLHGGIASGVAQVLGEEMVFDANGTPVTSNFADYAIISIDQLPQFELIASTTASSFNDLGFKGVGESGTIGAGPAVHNAIVDALGPFGVRHLDLPCTPQRIWEAIQAAR